MPDQSEEDFIVRLAETTDASPQQIKGLLKKHRGDRDAVSKEAQAIRAES